MTEDNFNYPTTVAEDSSTGSKFMKVMKRMVGIKDFNAHKALPEANQSYLKSRYGSAQTEKERLEEFFKECVTDINDCTRNRNYLFIKEIPTELVRCTDYIVNSFKEKGYVVVSLNNAIGDIAKNYIFVCWDSYKFDSHPSVVSDDEMPEPEAVAEADPSTDFIESALER